MNLTIAKVLNCTDGGCQVQPIDSSKAVVTAYSQNIVDYNIPIRPNQFVIVDQALSLPETLFRFTRATVTKLDGEQIVLDDDGAQLLARRASALEDELKPGIEVVLDGYTDEDRQVIDIIVDDRPAHAEQIAAKWFPQMERSR